MYVPGKVMYVDGGNYILSISKHWKGRRVTMPGRLGGGGGGGGGRGARGVVCWGERVFGRVKKSGGGQGVGGRGRVKGGGRAGRGGLL